MLTIRYHDAVASWDKDDHIWRSKDKGFIKTLNQLLPEEALAVDAPFREGGVEGIVLDRAKEIFGKEIEVLVFEPTDPPPDEDDIDY